MNEETKQTLDEKLEKILEGLDFTPTKDQWNAFNTAIGNNNTLIIGKPGAGKSTIVKLLVEYLGDKLLIGSTTGISNQRLLDGKGGAGSMHRIFDLPINMYTEANKKKVSRFATKVLGSNPNLEYVLIDEAGFLLNSDLLELIFLRIERFNKKTRKRPRRDMKLILCGDLLQLPPFFKKHDLAYMNEKYGSPYFFKSKTFKEKDFKVVNMHQVVRTDDNVFKACLDAMRYNQKDRYPKLCNWVNKIMFKHSIPEGLPVMSTRNDVAAKANELALKQNPNTPFTYTTTISGKYNIKNCPAGDEVTLKEGCLVMTVVNDLENEKFQNGSIAKVTMCTSEGVYLVMEHSNEEVFVGMHEFEQTETTTNTTVLEDGTTISVPESSVTGVAIALPCILAYGLSIHKNQGATISSPCVVDLGKDGFSPYGNYGSSFAYVALSRFTSPELVYLKYPLKPSHIKSEEEILEWVMQH